VQKARLSSREFVPDYTQTSISTVGQEHDIFIRCSILIQACVTSNSEPWVTSLAKGCRTITMAWIIACFIFCKGDTILCNGHQHRIRARKPRQWPQHFFTLVGVFESSSSFRFRLFVARGPNYQERHTGDDSKDSPSFRHVINSRMNATKVRISRIKRGRQKTNDGFACFQANKLVDPAGQKPNTLNPDLVH